MRSPAPTLHILLTRACHSLVLGSILLGAAVNQWQALSIIPLRKAAKVPYPNSYAPRAEAEQELAKYRFNCAQRAHANLLENLPNFVIAALIAGLRFPAAAAMLGVAWSAGRVVYARGYASSTIAQKGDGRYRGIWFFGAQLGLFALAGWTVVSLVV